MSEMRDYQTELLSYTKGLGRLSCTFEGYRPCHNAEEVILNSAMIRRRTQRIPPVLSFAPTAPVLQ